MNILTIGVNPFLNTSISKLHESLAVSLSKDHRVNIISTFYDSEYFLPDKKGNFSFNTIPLYPYLGFDGGLGKFCIDKMKTIQPNIVFTIGNKQEHTFMAMIKLLYPSLFKWIPIITSVGPISESDQLDLNLADYVIVINKNCYDSLEKNGFLKPFELINFTPNIDIFKNLGNKRDISSIYCCRNRNESNIGCFVRGSNLAELNGYLHYNKNDIGDLNIDNLLKKHKNKFISTPSGYHSIKESFNSIRMNAEYNRHSVVIDCSMQPKTGLSVLEGFFAGCIPVCPYFGVFKELIDFLPKEYQFPLDYNITDFQQEEDAVLIDYLSLSDNLSKIKSLLKNNDWIENYFKINQEIVKNISQNSFLSNINDIISRIEDAKINIMVLDSY